MSLGVFAPLGMGYLQLMLPELEIQGLIIVPCAQSISGIPLYARRVTLKHPRFNSLCIGVIAIHTVRGVYIYIYMCTCIFVYLFDYAVLLIYQVCVYTHKVIYTHIRLQNLDTYTYTCK